MSEMSGMLSGQRGRAGQAQPAAHADPRTDPRPSLSGLSRAGIYKKGPADHPAEPERNIAHVEGARFESCGGRI